MSQEDDSAEKSHEPTQKKLDDARKKGEVPKSVDLTTAAAYAGLLLAAITFGTSAVEDLGTTLMSLIDRPDLMAEAAFGSGGLMRGELTMAVGRGIWPLFLVPPVIALAALFTQQALVFAPSKLEPKFSRISLIENAKQKFGRSGLFEFFKSFMKLSIYSVVLFIFLAAQLPRIMTTMTLDPRLIPGEMVRLTLWLLFIVLIIAAAIGVIDALFQHAEHIRKNRMSRKELMEELKQSEGDPTMKQQRREKAVQYAMTSMAKDVPEASVVIVNPTHYAIALKWDSTTAGAPICVAKGVDEIAARIREIAIENAVPIHSDPPTARALHAEVEVGEEIPPDHYRAVAAAIRFAERIRTRARGA